MSEYAVLSNSGMAVGWEMGRVRGIWTIYARWQWWMLAPKYSISDFFPALFIYISTEIGAIFDHLMRRLPRRERKGGEKDTQSTWWVHHKWIFASIRAPLTARVECKQWPSVTGQTESELLRVPGLLSALNWMITETSREMAAVTWRH